MIYVKLHLTFIFYSLLTEFIRLSFIGAANLLASEWSPVKKSGTYSAGINDNKNKPVTNISINLIILFSFLPLKS